MEVCSLWFNDPFSFLGVKHCKRSATKFAILTNASGERVVTWLCDVHYKEPTIEAWWQSIGATWAY